jgi:putative transcriptional regulator
MEQDRMTTTKRRTYRSDALRSAHIIARDLHAVGAIDKATMREFDVTCLTDVSPLAPDDIRRIREEAQMSQAVFAMALNVTTSLVSQWERGEKHPQGASLKLLALVAKNGLQAVA